LNSNHHRHRRSTRRLALACRLLDPVEEQSLAEEGSADLLWWADHEPTLSAEEDGAILSDESVTTGAPMYTVPENATIATVTDLRRRTAEVLEHAASGNIVVVQKDNEPQGVYLSFAHYQELVRRLERLEDLELLEVAVSRMQAIERGEEETVPLEEVVAEFAPHLAERHGRA
jgi:prevent-host-death family protein